MSSNSEDRSGSSSPGNMVKTRPLDDAFDVHLIDKQIFIHKSDVEPDHIDEIINKMAFHRFQLEESGFIKEKFPGVKNRNKIASTNVTIMSTDLPIVTGDPIPLSTTSHFVTYKT